MKKMKLNYFRFTTVMSVVLMYLFFLAGAAEGKTFTREQVIEKLQKLDNKSTVKALISRTSENITNNDDVISRKVSVNIKAEFEQGSLKIHYPQNLLERIDKERQANEKDPDSPMPVRRAAESINISEIQNMIAVHEVLIRQLKTARLVKQSDSRYKEQNAVLMEFDLPPNFSKQQKKYIKQFSSKLKLWLNENGLPLASERHLTMEGRALMVISFEGENSEELEYKVYQNRLLAVYKKSYSKNSGGGESGETRSVTTLSVE